MGGSSITATVQEAEIRNVDSVGFHGIVRAARIDEISLTDRPCNPHALITSRRDVNAVDRNHADLMASLERMGNIWRAWPRC